MSAVYVEITATRGSAPRDAGTAMKITQTAISGTIGGGALEHQAIATARQILREGGGDLRQRVPLGPGLGQCCGGSVELLFTRAPRPLDPAPDLPGSFAAPSGQNGVPLWIWGAGHVGRALIAQAPPARFDITWIDSSLERFPTARPDGLRILPSADMPRLAAHAPLQAHHLIMTYSHQIDLALCAALLRRGAASIGLIGSATKRARFQTRLTAMGLDPAPIICPIGDKSLGKAPAQIAQGTLSALHQMTTAAKETA